MIIEEELISVREQGFMYPGYMTPIEKSERASEYLISNVGKPLDFDKFHKEFGLTMDKGGELFPYDTLNWHTYLQLKRKGYEYKLFCIDSPEDILLSWNRYILVEKKDKIIYGSQFERDKRSFNHEFHFYNGARYNSNFEFVADTANDYPLYEKGLYYYTPMVLDIMKGSLLRQKEDIAVKPNTERLIKEIGWLLKKIDSIIGQITTCKSNKYKLSKELGESIIQMLEEFKEGREIYPHLLKYPEPELSKIEDNLQKIKERLYFTEFDLYEFIKEELPKYMAEKIEKEFNENNDLQKFLKEIENIDLEKFIKQTDNFVDRLAEQVAEGGREIEIK